MNHSSLVLVPLGAGKTRYLIETIYEHKRKDANLPIWVLFPDETHKTTFQERLFSRLTEGHALFRLETFVFDSLTRRLLEMCGSRSRVMSLALRQSLLKSILQNLKQAGKLQYFRNIVGKSGFREEISLLIDEFSNHQISTDTFAEHATSSKDQELALILNAYQRTMADLHLIDRLGVGRLALAELQKNSIESTAPLFLVDGFEYFSPLQANIIAAVAKTTEKTIITLSHVAAGQEEIHPLPEERYKICRDRLTNAFHQVGLTLNMQALAPERHDSRQPIFQHLAHNLFLSVPQQKAADNRIEWILSPNEEHEVRTIMRRVKHRLITSNAKPEQVVLALAAAPRYLPLIKVIAREYSIPLYIQIRQPLLQNPLIQAVLHFIRVASGKSTGDQLMQLIRSPYTSAETMDEASFFYLQKVCNGVQAELTIDQWRQRIQDAEILGYYEEELDTIQSRMMAWLLPYFEAIEKFGRSSHESYAQRLIETFALAEHPNDGLIDLKNRCQVSNHGLPARCSSKQDELALSQLSELLNTLRVSAQMFTNEAIFQPSFSRVLEELLQNQYLQEPPPFNNAVTITTIRAARGMNLVHCYVLGLSEDNLTTPESNSTLLLRAERDDFRDLGLALRLDQEGLHINEELNLICAATKETLTFSRAVNVEGNPASASSFWNAVEDCFTDASLAARTSIYELASDDGLGDCASEFELLNAWFSKRGHGQLPAILQRWVNHTPERKRRWQFIVQSVAIDDQRQRNQPPHSFSGRLMLPITQEQVLRELNEDYVWSANQLNELARCAYRFFAKRMLDLAPPQPDEENLASLYFGDLMHKALYEVYEPFRKEKIPIAPGNRQLALASLPSIVENSFSRHASKYTQLQERLQPSLMQPLREYVSGYLRRVIEADFGQPSPFQKWGSAPRFVVQLEDEFHETLDLIDNAPLPFRLRGIIDRIDRVGDRFIIIDYKSGLHHVTRNDLAQGLDLQLPLYLLAEQRRYQGIHNEHQFIALYWHLRNLKISTVIDGKTAGDMLTNVQRLIQKWVLQAANGDFSKKPTKPVANRCLRYCEYFELCRLARMFMHSPS